MTHPARIIAISQPWAWLLVNKITPIVAVPKMPRVVSGLIGETFGIYAGALRTPRQWNNDRVMRYLENIGYRGKLPDAAYQNGFILGTGLLSEIMQAGPEPYFLPPYGLNFHKVVGFSDPIPAKCYGSTGDWATAVDLVKSDPIVTTRHSINPNTTAAPPATPTAERAYQNERVKAAMEAQDRMKKIRAAYRAGKRPYAISRELGVSQSEVSNAISGLPSNRRDFSLAELNEWRRRNGNSEPIRPP